MASPPNTRGGGKATGKLPANTLARLLRRYAGGGDPSVLLGPGIGLDAAAVTAPGGPIVLASDPVTYAAAHIGRYAVHVNANDIFAAGAEPRWFVADILLPAGRGRLAEGIFRDIAAACAELAVTLVGGHTELTPDLPRPIVAGFMIGLPGRRGVLTADGARAGDAIVLTKGLAIEGTAILAGERGASLRHRLSAATVRRAKRFLDRPGLSVGAEAKIALGHPVTAMHDPTEGGLLNGLWEMAQAAGLTLEVDPADVHVYPETKAVCEHFALDPLKLLASGALLIACPKRAAKNLLAALTSAGIDAREIGRARRGPPRVALTGTRPITAPVRDEILKLPPACWRWN